MKQANDTLVARALLAEIQSAEPGAFGAPFTAERTYPTAQALDAVEGFRLTVAATQLASDLADRSGFQDSVGVEICVRCRIHSQPDQSLEYTAELDAARIAALIREHLGPQPEADAVPGNNQRGVYTSLTFWVTLNDAGTELPLRTAIQSLPGVVMQL